MGVDLEEACMLVVREQEMVMSRVRTADTGRRGEAAFWQRLPAGWDTSCGIVVASVFLATVRRDCLIHIP